MLGSYSLKSYFCKVIPLLYKVTTKLWDYGTSNCHMGYP
uniref:Uncharacterized protein n=1 Tax=Rhizophora mucronata TaxID=61149 RepID=A0A2P2N1G5_RHIMU